MRLAARAYDAKGRTISTEFEWSSADPAIATVRRDDGTVMAISAGATTVTAARGALRATATVSVRLPDPPVAISISPSVLNLIAGGVERLTARAFDSAGQSIDASFEWSSADPGVATIGRATGIVAAIGVGSTMVTVAAGAIHASATVSVINMDLVGPIAFTRWTYPSSGRATSDVVFFSAADQSMRSLPRPSQFTSIAAPAWSTDGTQLAVEVVHTYFPDDYGDYTSDLYVLGAADPAGSTWRALTTNGLSRSPGWSPDGTRIAYLQQTELFSYSNQIYVVDAAGGEPVRLTPSEGWHSAPRWSPDGRRLSFSVFVDDARSEEVFIVNADGSGLTNVTRRSASDVDPSWSPDGARLAFVSTRDNSPNNADVFVVDVDGSNVRRLTTLGGNCSGPVWSPDGRQIMFFSGSSLYLMNADGSSLVRLTTPPGGSWDSGPVWRR